MARRERGLREREREKEKEKIVGKI